VDKLIYKKSAQKGRLKNNNFTGRSSSSAYTLSRCRTGKGYCGVFCEKQPSLAVSPLLFHAGKTS